MWQVPVSGPRLSTYSAVVNSPHKGGEEREGVEFPQPTPPLPWIHQTFLFLVSGNIMLKVHAVQ